MLWDDLRCFVAVATAGTLSGGAKQLAISVPTIGRRLDALEASLGIRLVDRSPAGIQLTKSGIEILALAQAGASHFDEIHRVAAALRMADWPDPVRVSATEPIVSDILAPSVHLLFRADPNIRIDLQSATENARLASREADLAIRLSRPKGDSLVARKLAALPMSLYASRSYLRDRDPTAVDLLRERILAFNESYGQIPEIEWISDLGLGARVVLSTSSTRALVNAVRAGAGIALLPDVFARNTDDLVKLKSKVMMPVRTPWLLVHRDLRSVKQLRVVRSWIVRAFEIARDGGQGMRPRVG